MKLDLKDVTLCAIDSANVALTARALHLSMAQCDFADAVLFSDLAVEGAFRTIKIKKLNSLAEYQTFCLETLPKVIDAPFLLVVEWDGYVINPSAWKQSFRNYDYIGARWPHYKDGMTVGNSGFCLRSRRLQTALRDPRFRADGIDNVDGLICRKYRPTLEREFGIRFAPEDVADMFSYENAVPNRPTFGFHGLKNMWCHVEDAEMISLVDHLAPYVCRTGHYSHLLVTYYIFRKFNPLMALYDKLRALANPDEILRLLSEHTKEPGLAKECAALCEELYRESQNQ